MPAPVDAAAPGAVEPPAADPVTAPARPPRWKVVLVRPAVIAGGVWTAIYALLCATGQRFSNFYLTIAWQLIPEEILRADPIRSTYYLHIQPPLWNLALGSVLRWSPFADGISMQLLQFTFGVLTAALLASLLHRLGLRSWLAVVLALVATCSPDVLLNAFTPTYEMPVACGLVAMVWALAGRRRSPARSLLLATVFATLVVLTRSVYHPAWLVAVFALVVWAYRGSIPWRKVVLAGALPLVLVGGWMLKNELLFDRLTMSSWFGMNLQRAVIPVLPVADKQQMFDDGKISQISFEYPVGFGNYDLYEPYFPKCTPEHSDPATAVPLRVNEVKIPNLNYECFLPVFDQAGKDAVAVIKAHPKVFLEGRAWSARTWFALNEGPINGESPLLKALYYGYRTGTVAVPGYLSTRDWGTPIFGDLSVVDHFSLVMVALTVLVVVSGLIALWRVLRRRAGPADRDLRDTLTIAVAGVTVLWTFLTGITFELGEQARFRTMIDPLVVGVGLFLVARWAARRFHWTWALEPDDAPAAGTGTDV